MFFWPIRGCNIGSDSFELPIGGGRFTIVNRGFSHAHSYAKFAVCHSGIA